MTEQYNKNANFIYYEQKAKLKGVRLSILISSSMSDLIYLTLGGSTWIQLKK